MKKWASLLLLSSLAQASVRAPALSIPSHVAETVSRYTPAHSTRVIYHIQDLHNEIEPQINLADIVGRLERAAAEQGKYLVVAVEGASGPINIDAVTKVGDPKNRQAVASGLLKAGYLYGEEYAALVQAPGRIKIVGLEAADLYEKNVRAKQVSLASRGQTLRAVRELNRQLKTLVDHNFNPALAELEKTRFRFENGQIPVITYVEFLARLAPALTQSYPSIVRLLAVARAERSLDFDQVDHDRDALLKNFAARPGAQTDALMKEAIAFREGRMSALAYYSRLLGATPNAPPALSAYLAYLKQAESVSGNQVVDDATALEQRIAEIHLKHPLARALYDNIRWAEQQERFFDLSMMPNEWEKQRSLRVEALMKTMAEIQGFISEQVQDLGYRFPLVSLNEADVRSAVKGARDFYLLAEARNIALMENFNEVLNGNTAKEADVVLIAGGFHTPGLTRIMRDKNLGYIVLRPQPQSGVNMPDGFRYASYATFLRPPGGLATAHGTEFVAALMANPGHQPSPAEWPAKLGADTSRHRWNFANVRGWVWNMVSNALPMVKIVEAPVPASGESYLSEVTESLTTVVAGREARFANGFNHVLTAARPREVADSAFVIVDVDSLGLDAFLAQSTAWVRLFASLNEKALRSANGTVLFVSKNSDMKTQLAPMMRLAQRSASGITFVAATGSADISALNQELGVRNAIKKSNTFILSAQAVTVEDAQSVLISGVPHLAVAAFAYTHFKDAAPVVEQLSALLESFTPLRMNGSLTDRVVAAVLAQISA